MVTPYFSIRFAEQQIITKYKNSEIKRFSPGKTAISRKSASRPVKIAYRYDSSIFTNKLVLDYGKGQSQDCEFVTQNGGICYIYDFTHCPLSFDDDNDSNSKVKKISPNQPNTKFDIILCNYVFNVVVLEERKIIAAVLEKILAPNGIIIIGVREDADAVASGWIHFQDGYITSKGTFQSFYHKRSSPIQRFRKLFPNLSVTKIGRGTYIVKK